MSLFVLRKGSDYGPNIDGEHDKLFGWNTTGSNPSRTMILVPNEDAGPSSILLALGCSGPRPQNPELDSDNLRRFAAPVAAQFEHVMHREEIGRRDA